MAFLILSQFPPQRLMSYGKLFQNKDSYRFKKIIAIIK